MSSRFKLELYVINHDLWEIMNYTDYRNRLAKLADFGEHTVEELADVISNVDSLRGLNGVDLLPRKVTVTVEMED